MRSSAAREDTEATFAGQYETVLNVTPEGLLDAYKRVLSSKYSPRAISYRMQYGLDDRETPMCVVGLAMVDAQSSGVIYTLRTFVPKDEPKIASVTPVVPAANWIEREMHELRP